MRPSFIRALQLTVIVMLWTIYAIQAFKGVLIAQRLSHLNLSVFLNLAVVSPGLVLIGTLTLLGVTRRFVNRARAWWLLIGAQVVTFTVLSPLAVRHASSWPMGLLYWGVQVGSLLLALRILRASLLVRRVPVDPSDPSLDRARSLGLMLYVACAIYLGFTILRTVVVNEHLHHVTMTMSPGRMTDVLVARQSLDDDLLHPVQDQARLDRVTDAPPVVNPAFLNQLHGLLKDTWAFPTGSTIDPFAKLVMHGSDGTSTLTVDLHQGLAAIDGHAFYMVNWEDLMALVAGITPPPRDPGPTTTDRNTAVRVWAAPSSPGPGH